MPTHLRSIVRPRDARLTNRSAFEADFLEIWAGILRALRVRTSLKDKYGVVIIVDYSRDYTIVNGF